VLKSNAARIWDVGEMEYRLVAFMVNEMPMDQLAEIEANSHVRLNISVCTRNSANRIAFTEGDRLAMGVPPTQRPSHVLRSMQR
jgi:hypothetical protein